MRVSLPLCAKRDLILGKKDKTSSGYFFLAKYKAPVTLGILPKYIPGRYQRCIHSFAKQDNLISGRCSSCAGLYPRILHRRSINAGWCRS
mmetsp:Transcript_14208/g.23225  ORF Transcript_14208/g.23225 Transcript_14208/m.23225 type:complete len:90 (-) Transcript_14208:830-1099(-)